MIIATLRTVIMFLIITVSMRLMGKRQIGELQPNELVTTILISNLASLPIEETDISLLTAVIPVMVIVALEIIFSVIEVKSDGFSKIITGESKVIIRDGIIDQNMLKKLRFKLTDLLGALRAKEVFDVTAVEFGVIETNGTINVFKKTENGEQPMIPVIIDGTLNKSGLEYCKRDANFVRELLRDRGLSEKEVFLLSLNNKNEWNLVKKEN